MTYVEEQLGVQRRHVGVIAVGLAVDGRGGHIHHAFARAGRAFLAYGARLHDGTPPVGIVGHRGVLRGAALADRDVVRGALQRIGHKPVVAAHLVVGHFHLAAWLRRILTSGLRHSLCLALIEALAGAVGQLQGRGHAPVGEPLLLAVGTEHVGQAVDRIHAGDRGDTFLQVPQELRLFAELGLAVALGVRTVLTPVVAHPGHQVRGLDGQGGSVLGAQQVHTRTLGKVE